MDMIREMLLDTEPDALLKRPWDESSGKMSMWTTKAHSKMTEATHALISELGRLGAILSQVEKRVTELERKEAERKVDPLSD